MTRFAVPTLLASFSLATADAQVFTASDRQPTPAELASIPAVIPEKA
ncbi:MAG: hypothetical protein IT576_16830, partial [Verrucomicrobiales bacterium]|nr:hypothetical protein [Verrucomicrobiales bacterium]